MAGLGFVGLNSCCTLTETGACWLDEDVLSCWDGAGDWGCEGGVDGDGGVGGGVCDDDEENWVFVSGWDINGGEPKMEAIFRMED